MELVLIHFTGERSFTDAKPSILKFGPRKPIPVKVVPGTVDIIPAVIQADCVPGVAFPASVKPGRTKAGHSQSVNPDAVH